MEASMSLYLTFSAALTVFCEYKSGFVCDSSLCMLSVVVRGWVGREGKHPSGPEDGNQMMTSGERKTEREWVVSH